MTSRAVLRFVQPANESLTADCAGCGVALVYSARNKPMVVIANCYKQGKWDRVEQWCPACYEAAGNPHGPVDESGCTLKSRSFSRKAG